MSSLPLAHYQRAVQPVLLGPQGAVSAGAFFARAGQLAAALPPSPFVINLCETRAGFMLGFAAALMRGQASLLPSGPVPADWQPLRDQYAGAYLLCDKPIAATAAASAGIRFELTAWLDFPAGEAPPLDIAKIDEAQLAAILFTSGSTGQPSAHAKSWGQLCRGARGLSKALQWPMFPACAVVGSVPPQHMFGLEATVMLPWQSGIPVHGQRPLLAADLAQVLAQYSLPCWWMTTAAHLRAPLCAAQAPSMRRLLGVLASTMRLPPELAAEAESTWQVPALEIYGSTETGALAIRRTASETAWRPLDGVRLWNGDESAGSGHDGAKGTMTAGTMTAARPRSWAGGGHIEPPVELTDELELMADGRFLLLGRANDLVKVGGKRASLAALDQHLCAIPGVSDGAWLFADDVLPLAANDESGSLRRPVAFYVSATLSPQQVAAALRTRIDPVFMPRPLYQVAVMPRNATGKLPRSALVELLAQCRHRKFVESPGHQVPAPATTRLAAPPLLSVAADHPALPGHFPGTPIVPGVLILSRVAAAMRAQFVHLKPAALLNARFHRPLAPDEHFIIELRLDGSRLRFEVRAADGPASALAKSAHLVAVHTDAGSRPVRSAGPRHEKIAGSRGGSIASGRGELNASGRGELIASGQWACSTKPAMRAQASSPSSRPTAAVHGKVRRPSRS